MTSEALTDEELRKVLDIHLKLCTEKPGTAEHTNALYGAAYWIAPLYDEILRLKQEVEFRVMKAHHLIQGMEMLYGGKWQVVTRALHDATDKMVFTLEGSKTVYAINPDDLITTRPMVF